MINFEAIVLVAGSSERASLGYNKILYLIDKKPIFLFSVEAFLSFDECERVILVGKKEEKDEIMSFISDSIKERVEFVEGGASRQESVLLGAKASKNDNLLVHDGARPCLSIKDIKKVLMSLERFESVTLVSKSKECLRYIDSSGSSVLKRENIFSIKTPQGLKRKHLISALKEAFINNEMFYDDVSAVEKYCNIAPNFVIGEDNNIKVTTKEDLLLVESLLSKKNYRIGHSKDFHKLVENRKMIIGGVEIPFNLGIKAHSDGDVLYHAISEAVIGALALGDLGKHFPDTDPKYKDISSSYFLEETKKMLEKNKYKIENIDAIILIERPMMAPYIEKMRENIANIYEIPIEKVNVKATRGEEVGPIGEGKAVASEAVVMIKRFFN